MGYSYKNRSFNNKSFKNRGMIEGGRNVQFAEMQEVSIHPSKENNNEEVNDINLPMQKGGVKVYPVLDFIPFEKGNDSTRNNIDNVYPEIGRFFNKYGKDNSGTMLTLKNLDGAIIRLKAGNTYFFEVETDDAAPVTTTVTTTATTTAAAAGGGGGKSTTPIDPKFATYDNRIKGISTLVHCEIFMVQIPELAAAAAK